jgi:hypothetical protein
MWKLWPKTSQETPSLKGWQWVGGNSGKVHPPLPGAWRASTLRLIADHFYPETPDKQIVISPSSQMREEWAEFLRQEADRLDNGSA